MEIRQRWQSPWKSNLFSGGRTSVAKENYPFTIGIAPCGNADVVYPISKKEKS